MSLYCPRCEKPLDHHDESGQCPKRLTRRFFLGALGSTLGAVAAAKYLPNVEITEAEPEQLVVAAAPRIHRTASIRIDAIGSSIGSKEQFIKMIERIAIERQVPVIGFHEEEVVHFVDPVKERLL
jgi:hypothetical protein